MFVCLMESRGYLKVIKVDEVGFLGVIFYEVYSFIMFFGLVFGFRG